ncbi:dihydroorotate dehydrogenase 1B, catalytic subunit [Campylobacter blaseri]|uniref:Dihydroorotate dehydrogenase n=1 Tax=Campylobacter blaseri TaxID=2042961 RepID=A0A2P8QZV4_9BACT|nr:dihydroorotate dehydrogenase [Campylobacter blaseri]PSM51773.1 dihydroorotate dehydrogenase B catalytic subunit [Campylobacter blaseri]PSM53564.1 dihydroorotate dehydrogenase B catalytic subunit [Campylobacter blaseri]QKF86373.1 dihydroorotate dehydrogenase 1B, catalytic subunit [Campylobacter blaseri]
MVDLRVNLNKFELSNPIIPASGTFGFGYEFSEFYDINILGSISLKGTTLNPRFGNPTPRIAECEKGMINSVGLQNPGVHRVINEEIKKLKKVYSKKVIANISGFSVDEYLQCVEKFNEVSEVEILEINISCPNVKDGGISFGTCPDSVYNITKKIKEIAKKDVFIKLSPNVTNISEIAKAAENGGADGISMINTLIGARFDIKTAKPIIHNIMGGFSGPAIKPIALAMIYQVYKAVKIPIIGMGGVMNAKDVVEMMYAGASAVQIGSANCINPYACKNIIESLPLLLEELSIKNIKDIIGKAHNV